MVRLYIFGEDMGRNPHHSDSENWWLQVVASDEDIYDQNEKPSIPSFSLSSA